MGYAADVSGVFSSILSCTKCVPVMPAARFRLVDLATAVFVGALSVSLVLPALARQRAAARATSCSQNFKMIGLALHNYHDVYGLLPPGRIMGEAKHLTKDPNHSRIDRSVGLAILPFLEEVRA
jgi:hypothetical protein